MTASRRRPLGCLFVFLAMGVVFAAAAPLWLPVVGTSLDVSGQPQHADVAVVLGGDTSGLRILRAAELAKEGYVPQVLASGPSGSYGFYECDLAIAFAVKNGYPERIFVRGPHDARSTEEEAAALVPQMRRMGVKRFLLVTSDFHTRRAGWIFHRAAPDLQMCVVSAQDAGFQLRHWWREREGRKTIFLEWVKTITERVGLS